MKIEDIGNVVTEVLEDREKFVLKAIAEGWTGQEIGDKLGNYYSINITNKTKSDKKDKTTR